MFDEFGIKFYSSNWRLYDDGLRDEWEIES